jgi:hypothetical protein
MSRLISRIPCALTSELTGTQRHCAARRKLPRTACGAMPLRVRVERPVRPHRFSASMKSSGVTSAWRSRPASADLQFCVHRDDASLCVAPHHHVTSALPKLDKTQTLQSSLRLRTRNSGQLRHGSA